MGTLNISQLKMDIYLLIYRRGIYLNIHSQIQGTHGHNKTDFKVLSISRRITELEEPHKGDAAQRRKNRGIIYGRSLPIPLRDYFPHFREHIQLHPAKSRENLGMFGHYFHLLPEAARSWLWEGRPGAPQPGAFLGCSQEPTPGSDGHIAQPLSPPDGALSIS